MSEDSLFTPVLIVYGKADEEYRLGDPICDEIGVHGCTKCLRLKLLTAFPADGKKPGWRCLKCEAERHAVWRADNLATSQTSAREYMRRMRREQPEVMRRWKLRNHYGPGIEEWYEETFVAQEGVCAICGEPPEPEGFLYVDHDHKCCPDTKERTRRSCGECLRCLLCNNCNSGTGFLRDEPLIFLNAAAVHLKWELRLDQEKAAKVAEHLEAIRMLLEAGDA